VVDNEETGEERILAPDTGFAGVLSRPLSDAADTAVVVVRLFDEARPALFRYLRWQGASAEEADDAIQESFLRLHTHLQAGRSQENLRAWVFRVAGNLLRDERKSGHRRFNRPLEIHADDRDSWSDQAAGPEQLVIEEESGRRLKAAILRLPELERNCVALRSEGFRYREIGGILGIGTSTVCDALQRALSTLARELP
jgi:RNA polymerase sigma-70 factor, ECF subfamily